MHLYVVILFFRSSCGKILFLYSCTHTRTYTQVRKLEEKGVHEMTQVQLCEKTLSKVIEKSSATSKIQVRRRVRRALSLDNKKSSSNNKKKR